MRSEDMWDASKKEILNKHKFLHKRKCIIKKKY